MRDERTTAPESEPLPHSIEAERAVLGGLMLRPGALDEIELSVGDFYRDAHGKLYALMLEMHGRGEPIEMVAVTERVIQRQCADECGGLLYVSSLPDTVPSTENLDHYAGIVRERAGARRLLLALQGLQHQLRRGLVSCEEAGEVLATLAAGEGSGSEIATVAEVSKDELWPQLEREAAGEASVYLPSGIRLIDEDEDFGGISSEGVTIVLGASGMGKTSFLNRLALGMASRKQAVYLYGTETERKRRVRDLTFSLAGLDGRAWAAKTSQLARLKAAKLPVPDDLLRWIAWAKDGLRAGRATLDALPIVVSNSGRTVDQVCARARLLRRQGRCDVVIADYLQDFVYSRAVKPEMKEQVGHASKMLKDLASSLNIPVVVGAQRRDEMDLKLTDGLDRLIPQMSDIQHNSKAFQDAEEIYALYRADFYRDRAREQGVQVEIQGPVGAIQVVARKRRSGPLLSWDLPFYGPTKWVAEALGEG